GARPPLDNHSAASGDRVAVFLTVEYEIGGIHQTLVRSTTVEILEESPTLMDRRGLMWIAAGLLALGWLGFVVHRHRSSRPGPLGKNDTSSSNPPHNRARDIVDAGVVLASVGFVASFFPSSLLFSPTTTSGGDMASHYYTAAYLRNVLLPRGQLLGWCLGNYAGFAFLQFYFPLPFVLMAALSFVVPLTVAFKLVTVLGTLLLPVCAYLGLRLMGSPFPGPALGAVASLCFLFMEANSMWGGNIPSTLAGEFSFSLGFALAILFLGALRWTIRNQRGHVANGVLIAIIGFAHGYALLWAGIVSLLELVSTRGWWRRFGALVAIHGLAILIMAFWLFPLLRYTPWTTAFNPVWHLESWQDILPSILWPAAAIAILTTLAQAILAIRGKQSFPRVLGALWGAVGLSFFFYLTAHSFHVVDIRFMPFLQVVVCLLAAAGLAQFLSRLPAPEVWPVIAILAVIPFVQSRTTFIPGWIEWNYSGFESKASWPTLEKINRHLEGDFRYPRVAYEHSPDHDAFGTVRTFENLPLFSGRSTLEGVYMQASTTAPFIFYIQSEISKLISCPFPDWGCSHLDLRRGLEHLAMFNVSQLILKSSEAKQAAAEEAGLVREASFGAYEIHRVRDSDGRYAVPLTWAPTLITTPDWKAAAYRWFKYASREDPVPVFSTRVSEDERRLFAAEFEELPAVLPRENLPASSELHETIDIDRITLTGTRPGHPVLIRVSYHPRWRALTGERVWLAGPSFMLVFPRSEKVELAFGGGPVVTLGRLATALGCGILLLSSFPLARSLREKSKSAAETLVSARPLSPVAEFRHRVGQWQLRTRSRVLWSGVGLVCFLLVAFAVTAKAPDADATYREGQELFNSGRFEEAARFFETAHGLAPLSMTAIHSRYFEAISYFKMERWEEAEARFLALIETFPESPNVAEDLYHIGLCRQRSGNPEGAIAVWQDLRRRFPQTEWAGYAGERLEEMDSL
ncbi:MAG: 6-pyruvoyl-tetrahydropterin synthase-related protein, partial [Acidobacteriota bacterium]|nr:6-pyruvoyl-tetrahydropterin synthase-related protein [Acidobacteriota bacterium]